MTVGPNALGPLPVDLQTTPALLIVVLLDLLAHLQPPFRHTHCQAALEHEGAATLAHKNRLEISVTRSLVARCVWPVSAHGVVEAGPAWHETALTALLSVVGTRDQPHELRHVVAVVPGRAERVLGHQPAWREDDEVRDRGARVVRERREHGEDGRIGVVVRCAPDRVEAT